MQERALNRDYIHHMQPDYGGIEAARKVESVSLGVAGVLGGVDADEDVLEHCGAPLY